MDHGCGTGIVTTDSLEVSQDLRRIGWADMAVCNVCTRDKLDHCPDGTIRDKRHELRLKSADLGRDGNGKAGAEEPPGTRKSTPESTPPDRSPGLPGAAL